MSKAELLQELESLNRDDLDEVAEKVDQLRGGEFTAREREVVRERIAAYRKDRDDVIDLDEAVAGILGKPK